MLNSWFDGKSLSIKHHDNLDLGIAVDTPDGLFVPVLRDVGNRGAADLKEGMSRLRADVKARSIPPRDFDTAAGGPRSRRVHPAKGASGGQGHPTRVYGHARAICSAKQTARQRGTRVSR